MKRIPFRLLPATIGLASFMLLIKSGQFVYETSQVMDTLISPVKAEDKKEEAEKPKEETKGEEPKKEEKTEGEEKKEEGGHGEAAAPPKPETPPKPPVEPNNLAGLNPEDRRFSPQELELLQQLSKRREQLDEWEKNIALKENLLTATEKRLDEKLVQMDALKKELTAMLTQYDEQENAKIKSLVKIYENMKPKDAARIFDEVDMPVLLLVIDKMAEKKVSPILAGMDPKKAKQLTVELAQQRKLQGDKLSNKAAAAGVTPQPAAPPPAKP